MWQDWLFIYIFHHYRDKRVPDKLPKENVREYDVKWTENGVDLSNEGRK